jgi:exosome complex component RRP46
MIKISIQVLGVDGSLLSAAINSMVLALLDAGIQLRSTCCAVSCMVHNDGSVLLDPTALELEVVPLVDFRRHNLPIRFAMIL